MSDSLHFAFEYHDRGWPVVPVVGKAPAIAWAAYQEKRPTLDQVRDWFAGHDYNLAVVTGSVSELVVIDCDTSEDASWWEQRFPATPLVVFTGGGGKHFYYRYPASRVSNRTRMFGRRIDIRAEGGRSDRLQSASRRTDAPRTALFKHHASRAAKARRQISPRYRKPSPTGAAAVPGTWCVGGSLSGRLAAEPATRLGVGQRVTAVI